MFKKEVIMKQIYVYGLMLLGFISLGSVTVKAQCPIKDAIMGDVPDGSEEQEDTYSWVEKLKHTDQPEYTPNTLIVSYDVKVGKKPLLKAIKKNKCELLNDYKRISSVAIKIPTIWNINDAMLAFKQVKGVTVVNRGTIKPIENK